MKRYLMLLVLLFTCLLGFSQGEDDHINWSFNKYSFAINDTWKMDITPIIRLNQDFTNYQNSSIDYMLKRSIGNGLSIGIMGRSWFIPDQKLRQFVWFDLNHQLPKFKIPIGMRQRLRFHGALDINERMDGDFLRYHFIVYSTFKESIIQPFVAIEPFYRFNELNYFERFRTELGFNVKAGDNLKIIAFLRKEDLFNFEEVYTNFIWMTGMQYTFDQPLFKKQEVN